MRSDKGKKTILLVEDEGPESELLEYQLSQKGFTVITAFTSEKAIELVDSREIHLILMDVDVVGAMDGAETAKTILEKRDLPIVFLTGHTEQEYVEKAKRVENYGCIYKHAGEFVIMESVDMAFRFFSSLKKHEGKHGKREYEYKPFFHGCHEGVEITSQEGIWLIDSHGYTTYVNSKIENILGYSREEMIGKHLFEFMDDQRVEKAKKYLRRREQGISEQHDFEFIAKNGERVFVLMETTSIIDDAGCYKGALAMLMDISGRRKAEAELRERDKTLSSIVNNSTNLFYRHDINHRLTYVSYQVKDILGYEPEEAMKFWTDMATDHPINKKGFRLTMKAIETGEAQPVYELELRHKNGNKIRVEVREAPLVENGKTIAIVGALADITERKKAEEALKKSEERLRLVLGSSKDIIVMLDTDWKYLYYNGPSEFGLSSDDILGKTPYDFYDKMKADALIAQLDKVKKNGISLICERNTEFKGREFWFSDEFHPVFNSQGVVIAVTIFSKNITDRKESEVKLNMYRLITSTVNDSMSFVDVNYIYHTVNDAYCELRGLSQEKIIGRKIEEILGKDVFQERIKPNLDRCFSGRVINYQAWEDFPGKGRRFMDTRYFPLNGVDGAVLGAVVQSHDMTSEKHLREGLKRAERDWRDSFNSLDDVMMVVNRDFEVEKINDNGLDLLGLSREEVVGKKCYELIHKKYAPEEVCPFLKSMKTGKIESSVFYEDCFKRTFSIKSSPVFNEKGEIIKFVDLMRDISDLKSIQQELQEANDTKDRFFGIIAHDLRNPVITFGQGLEILNDHLQKSGDDFAKRISSQLYENSQVMSKLLENLLEWSRLQRGKVVFCPVVMNLSEAVKDVVGILENSADQKRIDLVSRVHEKTFVFADRNMLWTILRNIISNAVKFTGLGGKVEIFTEDEKEWIEVFVKDNGVGIEEKFLHRIFHVDFDYHEVGTAGEKGSGLGLILCKEFVEIHGGTIRVESRKGEGSTFIFNIPKN